MPLILHGFSWDADSSYARGAAHGPEAILSHLFSEASSPFSLDGVDVGEAIASYDFEGLPADGVEVRDAISSRIATTLEAGLKPLSLGGDHSVTFPILRAVRDQFGPVNVLQVDAHTDLYDEFEGNRFSHACPFRRAIEDGCIARLVQVGLRSVSPDARAYGDRHDVVMLGADEMEALPHEELRAPLYVSVDLDGVDPAFAPGVAHPEPGGFSSREVIGMIRSLGVPLVGADVVELNPGRDIGLLTTHLAVRLVKELAAALVR